MTAAALGLSPRDASCARCSLPWHLGAVHDGEEAKRITFAQLEALARGTFSGKTLRTYSRKDRGAGKFYGYMTKDGNEVRYSACESNLVLLRHKGIATTSYQVAITEYDRRGPTTRRLEALERQLARDVAEIDELERCDYSDAWMRRWIAVNARIEYIARWIDGINRNYGFSTKDGMFVTDRFTTRKAKLRALFSELTDAAYAPLFEEFRRALYDHGAEHLLDEGEPT